MSVKTSGQRAGLGVANVLKLAGGIPLLLLGLAAWAVALAGVSIVRHEAGTNSVYGYIGFTWFVIFGSLFVLLAALIHIAGVGFRVNPIGHSGVAGLLAVFTTLTMLETNKWNEARKATPYSEKIGKGAVTAFAGFLALAVANALLILVLGNSSTPARDTEVYQTTQVHQNPVGTVPVAPATAV